MIQNPIPWPNGARCAVAVTFDMDADSFLHLHRPKDSYKLVSTISSLRYGPEVAIPRIVQSYRDLGIKQTFFVPAWCIEQYPKAVGLMVENGHEVGHHGYIHEHPNELTEDEERYWLQRSIGIIEQHTGQRPRGFRAPLYNFSQHTTDLLVDEGFSYDASLMGDDIPYLIEGDRGELVELPSHWGLDDWPPYVHMSDIDYLMPIKSPQEACAGFRAEFDAAYEYGGLWVPVWHPFVSGRLARWAEAVKLIEYILDKGDVWVTTMEDIARHVQNVRQQGQHTLRTDKLPYYEKPVLIDKLNT